MLSCMLHIKRPILDLICVRAQKFVSGFNHLEPLTADFGKLAPCTTRVELCCNGWTHFIKWTPGSPFKSHNTAKINHNLCAAYESPSNSKGHINKTRSLGSGHYLWQGGSVEKGGHTQCRI